MEMAEYVEELYGIHCHLNCKSDLIIQDNQVATQLFRIAQEATTNACKHAGATNVCIRLAEDADGVVLSVTDDGHGIGNVDDLMSQQKNGMGLRSMNYRARIIEGKLLISNCESGGTEVKCFVSCDTRDSKSWR